MIKMLPFIALYILLAIDIAESTQFSDFFEYDVPHTKLQYSTDILDDHSSVLVTSVYDREGSRKVVGSSIKVITSKPNSTTRSSCFVPFKYGDTIRRLSSKTVLLSANELNQSRDLKLILVNTDNCEYKYAYNGTLSEKRWIDINKKSSDESFTVIMLGSEYCHGYHWCRLFFNPLYYKFQPLDLDVQLHVIHYDYVFTTSFNGNVFVGCFNEFTNNTYRMRMYDFTNDLASPKYKDLITIENWYRVIKRDKYATNDDVFDSIKYKYWLNYRVKSSTLSHCWNANFPGNETIHCSVFREDGSLMLNQTLVYPEPMYSTHIENIPGGMILFTEPSNTQYWMGELTVQVAVITKTFDDNNISDSHSKTEGNELVDVKYRRYKMACVDIAAYKTKMNESSNVIKVEYMCYDDLGDRGIGTSIHVFYIK